MLDQSAASLLEFERLEVLGVRREALGPVPIGES
jgi:hypothetical protein